MLWDSLYRREPPDSSGHYTTALKRNSISFSLGASSSGVSEYVSSEAIPQWPVIYMKPSLFVPYCDCEHLRFMSSGTLHKVTIYDNVIGCIYVGQREALKPKVVHLAYISAV